MNVHVNSASTGRVSNAGRNMVHLFSRSPAYPDLLARARREDRRLSLIERETQSIWVAVEWLNEWKQEKR
jgi:pantoate kinase